MIPIKTIAKELLLGLLDLLYPNEGCIVCNNRIVEDDSCFCSRCLGGIPFIGDSHCKLCGKASKEEICSDCQYDKRYFDQGFSVVEYKGAVPELIYKFKYKGQRWLSESLGKMMAQKVDVSLNIDAIIPVPLHTRKLKERGFNQAELLAREISDRINKPMLKEGLLRVRDTKTQNTLSLSQRKANLIGAFHMNEKIDVQGLEILLVDDIFTTGSTINQCSKALKESGAKKVYFVTFASGTQENN